MRRDHPGIDEALDQFPDLALKPSRKGRTVIGGELDVRASTEAFGEVQERFSIEIVVPRGFPYAVPSLRETGGRIPDTYHCHVDGSRCLGSPFHTDWVNRNHPTLRGFIEKLVIPYLYGYSVFERTGVMPFGELAHGVRGLLDEYGQFLGVADDVQCIEMLDLAGMKRRVANKYTCPCQSGLRVGDCHHVRINALRYRASRRSFPAEAAYLRRKLKEEAEGNPQTLLEVAVYFATRRLAKCA